MKIYCGECARRCWRWMASPGFSTTLPTSRRERLNGSRPLPGRSRGRKRHLKARLFIQAFGQGAVDEGNRGLVVRIPRGEVMQGFAIHPIRHGRINAMVLEGDQVMGRLKS